MRGFGAPAFLTLAALALASCSGAGQKETASVETGGTFGDGHARLRLLSEDPAIVPGDTLHVGVSFDIEPGWHLYWNGRNDSGLPVMIEWRLPPGFVVGETLWPAPERHVSPGRILDHVYHDRVTLIVPIRVPEDAGDGVSLSAAVNWLVCKDLCLPGQATVSLKIPGDLADTSAASRFRESRSRLPRPLDPSAGIALRWDGNTLRVEAPGADSLAFYPFLDCATLSHPIEDGASASGRLALRVAPADRGQAPVVAGVLEVRASGGPALYTLREPVPTP